MKNRTFRPLVSDARRPRKRGTSRLFVLGAAFASSAAVSAAGAMPAQAGQATPGGQTGLSANAGAAQTGDPSASLRFDIRSGPLSAAIQRFEELTHLKVTIATAGIEDILTPGVFGLMTPQEALEQMLNGTNVSSTVDADGVTLGVRGPNEFVAVAAEEPKVESPKYRAALRDTPQTVVVIPQQVFQEQNATSLRDVLRNTPGITMSIGEGASGMFAAGDNVVIRGFNARNDIYLDGVRDAGEVSRDTFNTETVEVAKGPTSVTGGRGATGGSINLVTKAASLRDSANFRVTGGSADYKRTTFDVNRRLGDSVAFRVNGMWQDMGYPGRDVAKNKGWGLAPSLSLGLNTATQLTLNYLRLQQDNVPDWGLPTLFPDLAIAQGKTVNDLDFSNWYGLASRDFEKTTSDVATVTLDHRFNNTLSLRNLTRYGKNYRDSVSTPPRPAAGIAGQGPEDPGYNPSVPQLRRTDTKYLNRDDRVATNQTDLTTAFSTGRAVHSLDAGLEVARDHQPTYATVDLFTNGRPPVVDLFNPTPYAPYAPALARTGATSDARVLSTAVYAFDTVKFNNQWQADLGLRWDRIKIDYTSVAISGVATDFGRTDKAVTGRAGIVYKPVLRGSIYAALSTSFAPSFDGAHGITLAATGVNSQALPPEKSRNIEVGTKWEMSRNLQITAAVFEMEKTNAKTLNTAGVTVLAGNQEVKGVEFGVNGKLAEPWMVFAGMALMDGTVKDSAVATEIGQQLAYVPKASFNLWSTYRFTKLTLGGGADFSNGHYFNQTGGYLFVSNRFDTRYVQNAAAIQALTKYWLFNAMASYAVNAHIQLQLNATNLGNERYADRAYDRHFLPGPTRQVLFGPVISF